MESSVRPLELPGSVNFRGLLGVCELPRITKFREIWQTMKFREIPQTAKFCELPQNEYTAVHCSRRERPKGASE